MPVKGHYKYDHGIFKLCSEIADVDVYYVDQNTFETPDIVKKISTHKIPLTRVHLKFALLISHYKFIKIAKKNKEPALFLSFSTLGMLFACLLTMNQKKIHLVCHNNLQRIETSWLNRIALKSLKLFNIELILLEDLLKKNLIKEYHYNASHLKVLYHPIPLAQVATSAQKKENKKIIISYVSGLYYDKGYDIFLRAVCYFSKNMPLYTDLIDFKVSLGQKHTANQREIGAHCLEKNNIEIFDHSLSNYEYEALLNTSSYICLPFRQSFKNRCSAVFFEALALKKPLILSSIELFMYYNKKYNSLGEIFVAEDEKSLAKTFEHIAINHNTLHYPGRNFIINDRDNNTLKLQLINILRQET